MKSLKPQKAKKDALDASSLLKHISDSSPGSIYQFKMDKERNYSFTYVSKGFEKLTGLSKDLLLKDITSVFQNVHTEDFQRFTDSITESADNMTQWNHKFRLYRPDLGKSIWIKGTSNPEKAEDGSILWNGLLLDVTESEELYEEYVTTTKRYEYATKATNDAIWDWDLVTDKLYWGEGFEKIFGYELTEEKSNIQFWEASIHPDDKERVLTSLHDAILEHKNMHWEENYRLFKSDGSIAYVSDRGYILHNKYDRPLRMVGAIQDITQVRLAEIEKQKLMDDLIKRNDALEQFTYIVSHNLRAPVANILGLAEIVQDESLQGEEKKIMTKNLLSAAVNLDNVLKDLNHILNNNMSANLRKEIIYFDSLLKDIKDELHDTIESNNAKFITDFNEAPNIKIVHNYIHNILVNLITNSIKFRSDKHPVIKITTHKNERFIYLEYEDNGIGIDLDKFGNKIFGLYKVFHPEKKGKGMGLFMVKTQIDNMQGEISVSSKVGKGTKFFLKFSNLL